MVRGSFRESKLRVLWVADGAEHSSWDSYSSRPMPQLWETTSMWKLRVGRVGTTRSEMGSSYYGGSFCNPTNSRWTRKGVPRRMLSVQRRTR